MTGAVALGRGRGGLSREDCSRGEQQEGRRWVDRCTLLSWECWGVGGRIEITEAFGDLGQRGGCLGRDRSLFILSTYLCFILL